MNGSLIFHEELERIIAMALAEDIGTGDITSQSLIPESVEAVMNIVAREALVACGVFLAENVYARLDASVRVETCAAEGQPVAPDTVMARIHGPARALLTGERVTLNLMQRACGVATLTARYVEAIRGTKAIILDTRKTMPGLRALDKYAVRAGGGQNHRMGLYDAVMMKDNHLALRGHGAESRIPVLVADVRKKLASRTPIIVECDTLAQVKEALAAMPDRILLDNMDMESLHEAVAIVAGKVPLEASGGVSLETVRAIAETGVDYISIGRITHSAPAADIAAEIIGID